MPGPPPKKSRRRRNPPAAGEWTVLGDPPAKRPPLPRPYPRGGYHPQTKAEWKTWWASPVASMWAEADHGLVVTLLRMVDSFWRGEASVSLIAEIRVTKNTLGLTPVGRQQRRWLLPDEAPLAPVTEITHATSVRRLRAVDPEDGER